MESKKEIMAPNLILELLTSIIFSLGISGIIALILCSIIHFIRENLQIETSMSNDELKNSDIPGFNDEIIKLTNERINQEIQISNAIETKAGILIGSVGTFSAIFISILFVNENFLESYLEIFRKEFLSAIPFIVGAGCLIASFILSIMVLTPRGKLTLLNPRNANNFLVTKKNLDEVKKDIKEKQIGFLEKSITGTHKDAKTLRRSFIVFGIGIASILVGLVIPRIISF